MGLVYCAFSTAKIIGAKNILKPVLFLIENV